MQQLEVSTEQRDGHVVVHLAGDIDVATAPQVRAALLDAVAADQNVVVDCARLEFLDSTGLGILIAARTRARAAGGSLLLTGVRPPLERLLAVTGVDRLFRLEPHPPAVAAG